MLLSGAWGRSVLNNRRRTPLDARLVRDDKDFGKKIFVLQHGEAFRLRW